MEKLIHALVALVGRDRILTSPEAQAPYLTDWRGRFHGKAQAVVLPGTVSEVASVVRTCAEVGMPIVPQGGNTSTCGGATPSTDGKSVVLALSRLNQIRDVDTLNNSLIAEAGVVLTTVQTTARAANRYFPLSLGAEGSCQIGGAVSTNAGGVHVLRYGMMRELVLGLEVVLPNGAIWHGLRSLRKDNTGYDLKQLFIGAEGTLGIVTAAALKIFPRPQVRAATRVAVASPQAAVALLGMIREVAGDRVQAFELMGETALKLLPLYRPEKPLPCEGASPWHVLVELADTWHAAPLDTLLMAALEKGLESGWVKDAVLASSEAQIEALWSMREAIPEAEKAQGVSVKHDIAVPVSAIPQLIDRAEQALNTRWPGCQMIVFGHVGDGNLHYNVRHDHPAAHAALLAQSDEVNCVVYDCVQALGGTISAEHGIGQLKPRALLHYRGELELGLMRGIKAQLDPKGIMNPGKILL